MNGSPTMETHSFWTRSVRVIGIPDRRHQGTSSGHMRGKRGLWTDQRNLFMLVNGSSDSCSREENADQRDHSWRL